MSFWNRLAAALAACTLAIPYTPAQQTTKDGILIENTVNRPDRPYRPAGSSDPRDRGPQVQGQRRE